MTGFNLEFFSLLTKFYTLSVQRFLSFSSGFPYLFPLVSRDPLCSHVCLSSLEGCILSMFFPHLQIQEELLIFQSVQLFTQDRMMTSKLHTCGTRNYKSVAKLLKLNVLLTWKMMLLSTALYFQLVFVCLLFQLQPMLIFFSVGNYQKLTCEYSSYIFN